MKKEQGITLIALVITIVVMLVLVGVTVTSIINSDLISKAKETGAQTKEASEAEPGQADDLMNSALGLIDNDIEILSEFFGKGWNAISEGDPMLAGFSFKSGVEPIPDADTSLGLMFLPDGEGSWCAAVVYGSHIYWVGWIDGEDGPITLTNGDTFANKVIVFGGYVGEFRDRDINLDFYAGNAFEYNNSMYKIGNDGILVDITNLNYIIIRREKTSDTSVVIIPDACTTWQDIIDSQEQWDNDLLGDTDCVWYGENEVLYYSSYAVLPDDAIVTHGIYKLTNNGK